MNSSTIACDNINPTVAEMMFKRHQIACVPVMACRAKINPYKSATQECYIAILPLVTKNYTNAGKRFTFL